MPCLLAVLVLLFPRLAIALLYFFTSYFEGMFQSVLLPLLGFLFLPLTLLAYAYLTKMNEPADAFYFIVIGIAVVLDLGLIGGGARRRWRN